MNLKNVFKTLKGMFAGAIGKKRTPLFVSWEITARCPSCCIYCGKDQQPPGDEFDTKDAVSLVEEIGKLGCIRVSLTGGEPMLREDLPEIISACKDAGIEVNINTSGRGAAARLKELKGVSGITLSLDGIEEVNDSIRGEGSFKDVMDTVAGARKIGISVSLMCVLSSENIDRLPEFLEFIKKEKLPSAFQPADKFLLRGNSENPAAPGTEDLKKAVNLLLGEKKNNLYIDSPNGLLRHFGDYPESAPLACGGGFIFCRVDPAGRVWRCGRVRPEGEGLDFRAGGFKKAFETMPAMRCSNCFGAGQAWVNLFWSRLVSKDWGK
ncbi:MAG: radical SAM protein [Chloroflexi bacterium]|nr:radical SAM protein [Chloroflexota bacterium]